MTLTLVAVKIDERLRDAFLRMVADYEAHEPDADKTRWYAQGREDFGAFVRMTEKDELGVDLPAYKPAPCSHRWLVLNGEIVGVVRVRHHIDAPFLSEEAGHIGYDVPPSQRGRGYGTACLRAGLDVARQLGLARVLLTTSGQNVASARVIERCGGVLEVERYSEFRKDTVKRYWIEVGVPSA